MSLNIFDIVIDENDLHSKIKCLLDPVMFHEKEVLAKWVDGFVDRDSKIIKEFQSSFHSAFWEFYLFAVFKECNFSIDFSKNRPDFIIKSPHELYIEAVVSEIKQTGRKEESRELDDILSMIVPHIAMNDYHEFVNEAITRYSNSIYSKIRKYKDYLKLTWVNPHAPFIIAIASYAQVNYGKEFHYPMLALLYGLYYDPKSDQYDRIQKITKPGTNAKIQLGLFNNSEMSEISAIIFSCTVTLGKLTSLAKSAGYPIFNTIINIRHDQDAPHFVVQEVSPEYPEELTDGLFVFHNPYAKNKLPSYFLADTNAIHIEKVGNGFKCEANDRPIVSRLNTFIANSVKEIVINDIISGFNPGVIINEFIVDEIDFDHIQSEITLFDKKTGFPFIVDLIEEQIEYLNDLGIKEGDNVSAMINTIYNDLGESILFKLIHLRKLG